jgi:1,4-alpha-glucan branching enzyme
MSYTGYFTFILHCHMPWVLHHGRWPHGSDWLCECIAETYLPLLNLCENLVAKDILPKFTIDISPILAEQLSHPDMITEFTAYLDQKIEAAHNDVSEYDYWDAGHMKYLAGRWEAIYQGIKDDYLRREGNILAGFRTLEEQGAIELITCGVTHGYLPLLGRDWSCRLQVKLGQEAHQRHFGRRAKGIWLPEMAYRGGGVWSYPEGLVEPGVSFNRTSTEKILSEEGLNFFPIGFRHFQNASYHLPLSSSTAKTGPGESLQIDKKNLKYVACEPFMVGESADIGKPVIALIRNPETALWVGLQFHPGERGYPARPPYLDFHKRHFPSGLRYWNVTNLATPIEYKNPYVPELALQQLNRDADDFEYRVRHVLEGHQLQTGKHGLLAAPFDGELFGHWWYEGVEWLGAVLERVHKMGFVKLATVSEYLINHATQVNYDLPEGSWGEGGKHQVWFNPETKWTWQILWEQENGFEALMRQIKTGEWQPADDLGSRVILQAARELLLAQASDWQFLINGGDARDYAERRFREHAQALEQLLIISKGVLNRNAITSEERNIVERLNEIDRVFPWIDIDKLLDLFVI